MNFDYAETLGDLSRLAVEVFAQHADPQTIEKAEAEGGFDPALWSLLAETGLLAATLDEEAGGAALGVTGLTLLLEQQGRAVVPVPLWPVIAGAAQPIAEFGSSTQRAEWLPRIVGGESLVVGVPIADATSAATSRADGVHAHFAAVEGATVATALLIPVSIDSRSRLALIPVDRAGVRVTPLAVTSRAACGDVVLSGVEVDETDLLPTTTDGIDQRQWVVDRCRIAQAGLQLGIGREALARAAAYTSEREQFGRPLSTNQAIALRAADAYLDCQALALTTMKAAWLADRADTPATEVTVAAMTAKWWAAHGGLRVVHAAQHLHGGLGADITYPIHRYFLWGRQVAFTTGSAAEIASELGALLPIAPKIGAGI